jgi:hypothetical protein
MNIEGVSIYRNYVVNKLAINITDFAECVRIKYEWTFQGTWRVNYSHTFGLYTNTDVSDSCIYTVLETQ